MSLSVRYTLNNMNQNSYRGHSGQDIENMLRNGNVMIRSETSGSVTHDSLRIVACMDNGKRVVLSSARPQSGVLTLDWRPQVAPNLTAAFRDNNANIQNVFAIGMEVGLELGPSFGYFINPNNIQSDNGQPSDVSLRLGGNLFRVSHSVSINHSGFVNI